MSYSEGRAFWTLLLVLVLGGVMINLWAVAGESRAERRSLREFPAEIAGWKQSGPDGRFDAATEAILRADDYLTRDFATSDGRTASLYVGYYTTQRTGATYHSPLNCLPGSGWEMHQPSKVTITPQNGAEPFEANSYIIERRGERQLLVYWYQGRGRATASEYWNKIYTVLDSVRLRRSDGAMVRVLVPVGRSEEEARRAAIAFGGEVESDLAAFVPN
jgi:EpsI family protein